MTCGLGGTGAGASAGVVAPPRVSGEERQQDGVCTEGPHTKM